MSLQRETDTDNQASGGSDSGDWIFTIREKDPKSLENGALQPSDLERNKVTLAGATATNPCCQSAGSPSPFCVEPLVGGASAWQPAVAFHWLRQI